MKKVLIISDEQQLLTSLEASSFSGDFSLHTLPGCEDTLGEITMMQQDLILVDFLLGSINGGALCHQIRGHEPIKHLPVILLSDYPNMQRFSAKFGCNLIVPKPVEPAQLIETFSAMLNKKEQQTNFLHKAC